MRACPIGAELSSAPARVASDSIKPPARAGGVVSKRSSSRRRAANVFCSLRELTNIFVISPPALEYVSKLEILAAKLPEIIARCKASGKARETDPALKGRKSSVCRTFSAGLKSDNSRRFTSGYYLRAASPPGIRVLTQALAPGALCYRSLRQLVRSLTWRVCGLPPALKGQVTSTAVQFEGLPDFVCGGLAWPCYKLQRESRGYRAFVFPACSR